jgi:hypothetical protein
VLAEDVLATAMINTITITTTIKSGATPITIPVLAIKKQVEKAGHIHGVSSVVVIRAHHPDHRPQTLMPPQHARVLHHVPDTGGSNLSPTKAITASTDGRRCSSHRDDFGLMMQLCVVESG